ncbi:MAG: hypothetical protein AAF740_13510 [Bacteroidota bacterium]
MLTRYRANTQSFQIHQKSSKIGLVTLVRYFLILIPFIFLSSCISSKPPVATYSESLQKYRVQLTPPPFPQAAKEKEEPEVVERVLEPPTNTEKADFDALLVTKAEKLALIEKAAGYCILLHSGRDPRLAKKALEDYKLFARTQGIEAEAYKNYEQPNYKVRIGRFFTRMDAYPVWKQIQEEFPQVIITPTALDLNELRREHGAPIVERVYETEEESEGEDDETDY